MKKLLFILFISCFIGCKEHYCTDEISTLNKKFTYKLGDVLTYKDSLSNLKYDTVTKVFLDKIDYKRSKEARHDDNYTQYDGRTCEATSFITFSNLFTIIAKQHCLECTGPSPIFGHLGYMSSDHYGYWYYYDFTYNMKFDSINYIYKSKEYKALKYTYTCDTLHSFIWNKQTELTKQNKFIYNDYIFIYDDDIKLVEYSTVDALHKKKRWVLVE